MDFGLLKELAEDKESCELDDPARLRRVTQARLVCRPAEHTLITINRYEIN